jgi:hypothetical protein
MRSFLVNSGPSLLLVAVLAVGGYIVLAPPAVSADQPAPIEQATHTAGCPVCRLTPFGHDGEASRFGPSPGQAIETKHAAF